MASILVVDDDPDFVRVTSRILESRDHTVTSAPNGEKALASMRKDKPDVVLLDIMMSYVLDGLDVLREMSEDDELSDVPVIMVTSLSSVRDTEALPGAEYVPADEWLSKPIDPETLLAKVDEALG
jgi:CheY-like chemotaxis protein